MRRVQCDDVLALRQRVLRPHQTLADCEYAGDRAPGSAHFAACDEAGTRVGVGSVSRQPPDVGLGESDWRVRGMATLPEVRGAGHGAALLDACIAHARGHGARRIWCNARTSAAGFYARAGFVAVGDEFELAGIGPHVFMQRALEEPA